MRCLGINPTKEYMNDLTAKYKGNITKAQFVEEMGKKMSSSETPEQMMAAFEFYDP